ncbi:hypothetical protein D9758_016912 [Tetrapyrgos nigripes]|uniref:Nephrocystin 3-like N-terminal domain-containing protein n=1 Tax=Tetrapyrgos nigripes TaxID=182062 RepID=A0A8H5C539_9AGAR|nr:hypothetical protein D9758_016912 [Tetrapyrgos nigripes]
MSNKSLVAAACQLPLFPTTSKDPQHLKFSLPALESKMTGSVPRTFFPHAHGMNFHHSVLNVAGGDMSQNNHNIGPVLHSREAGLQRLYQAVSQVGALHDSAARFPPPKCHEGTRVAVMDNLLSWIAGHSNASEQTWTSLVHQNVKRWVIRDHSSSKPAIHWLYGPAGAGKSAIAQTLCERLQRSHLAASFFFSRGSTTRNNPKYLFLTIAYCLAVSSNDKRLRQAIDEAVEQRPGIIDASSATQFQELIVKPLSSLCWLRRFWLPKLVVIDGLDECQSADAQKLVLTTIFDGLASFPTFPLRFLVASRPELTIQDFFNRPQLHAFLNRTILDDSFETVEDIKRYLRDGFTRIRKSCHDMELPSGWPSSGVVDDLAQRASGQFIYASTVLKYVEDAHSYPPERLQTVLGLPVGDAEAFADLDILYHQILSSIPEKLPVLQVLSFIFLTTRISNLKILERVFSLPRESVSLTLRGLHSVLHISSESVKIHHKSFADFLQDPRRSDQYFVDVKSYRRRFMQICEDIYTGSLSYPCDVKKKLDHWGSFVDDPDAFFKLLFKNLHKECHRVMGFLVTLQQVRQAPVAIAVIGYIIGLPTERVFSILKLFSPVLCLKSATVEIRIPAFRDFLLINSLSKSNLCFYPILLFAHVNCGRHEEHAIRHVLEHINQAEKSRKLIRAVEYFINFIPHYLDLRQRIFTKIWLSKPSANQEGHAIFLCRWTQSVNRHISSVRDVFQEWRDHSPRIEGFLDTFLRRGIPIMMPVAHLDILFDLEKLVYRAEPWRDQSDGGPLGNISNEHFARLADLVAQITFIHPENALEPDSTLQIQFLDFKRGNSSLALECMETILTNSKSGQIFSDSYARKYWSLHLLNSSPTTEHLSKLENLVAVNFYGGGTISALDNSELSAVIAWLEHGFSIREPWENPRQDAHTVS